MARIRIRVQPGARRAGLVGWMADGTLKVAVTAPPEGGRANAAVEALLSDVLGVKVRVARGLASRSKVVHAEGLGDDAARRLLGEALDGE